MDKPCADRRRPESAVELQTLAQEVQELLQTKIGTTAYSAVHTQIRQKAAIKRNERKVALSLQVCLRSRSSWYIGSGTDMPLQ